MTTRIEMLKPNFGSRRADPVYRRQKYYFPLLMPEPAGMLIWARALCILDDVEAFYQLLATEHVTMGIDDDLTISFAHSTPPDQYGPVYSRLVKKMWDTPAIRAVLDDFDIVAWNVYAQKRLS